jgi:pimeloyl-ACP methyl ester carboxylesterase
MTVTEYITDTFVDTYHPSLPLFTYVHSPSSRFDAQGKPLILLLHGAGGDHHHFDDVFPLLIENGYYTMVADMRYHGRSQPTDHHANPVFDFEVILQDLDRALTWFQKRHALSELPIVLGGISMGGLIAQAYALRLLSAYENSPVKIHAQIGIGCAHILISDPAIPWLTLYKAASYEDTCNMIPAARQSIAESAISQLGKARSASSLCLVDDKTLFCCFRACANALPTCTHDLSSIPQLLLRGESDLHTKGVMEAWYSNATKKMQTKAAYQVIPSAGHLVTMDKGHQTAEHIITFLTSQ